MTHFQFISKFNLYFVAVFDKYQRTSTLECYFFTLTGIVQDKFRLRSNSERVQSDSDFSRNSETTRLSVTDALNTRVTRQSSSPLTRQSSFSKAENLDNIKRMFSCNLQAKVKELLFCESLDYLTVCIDKGTLINLYIDITSQGIVSPEDSPEKTQMWCSEPTELKLEAKNFSKNDNLLLSFNYIQNESDTPSVDVRQTSDEVEDLQHKIYKQKFNLYSVSTAKVHNKLKCAALDQARCLVYSSDTETGIIHAYDLKNRRSAGFIKPSNARINKIIIDSDLQRLYATSKQGIFLIFDIQHIIPIMVHSMRLVLRPELGTNYAK